MKNDYVKLVEESKNISYSAVVLTEQSRRELLDKIPSLYRDVIAHHMTINMGSLKDLDRQYIGEQVQLKVISLASDEKVQAVGVEQLGRQPKTKNKVPHITISVDRSKGGKPFHSNKLKEWLPLNDDEVFILEGVVEEVPNK